jgi:hypothetical protein
VRRGPAIEGVLLAVVLAAQAWLFVRPIHNDTNYDEAVYLASLDALRHGQTLGTEVFAPQLPGFYDLLRAIGAFTGASVVGVRAGLLVVLLLGTVGAWLVGRRFGGPTGGILAAFFLVVAPPLDRFGYQVIADTPALALTAVALGLASLAGPVAAVSAGAIFAFAVSVKLTALTALVALAWLLRRRPWHALAGAALVSVALLALHASALPDLWEAGIRYHQEARGTPKVIAHPHRQILRQISTRSPFFWLAIAGVVVAAAPLVRRRPPRAWPLWTWVGLGLLFLLTHAPLHDNHLVIFPFTLAIAVGATLGGALPRRAPIYAAAAAVLAVAYVQQVRSVDHVRLPESESRLAASRALKRLVPPGSLTIDDRPSISFFAHRRVVGELVDTAFLRFETGSLTDADVIHELPRARAVVVSRSLGTRPRVMRAIRAGFALRYDKDEIRIYVKRSRTRTPTSRSASTGDRALATSTTPDERLTPSKP